MSVGCDIWTPQNWRSRWLQNTYYRGTPAERLRSLQVLGDGLGDVLPITPWIGAETGALECRGLLVHKWGILYPLGAVKNLLARPLASAVVWSLGFGCLWLALSPPSIVKCKQYLDAVGCQSLALPASFLSEFAFHTCVICIL